MNTTIPLAGYELTPDHWIALGAHRAYPYSNGGGVVDFGGGLDGDRRRARALCALERSAGDVCGALDLLEAARRTTAVHELAGALRRLVERGVSVTVVEQALSEVA